MKIILVVSAHPDDETFGCGGSLLKHKLKGDKLHWLIISNVDTAYGWPKDLVQKRQKEIDQVAAAYSFTKVHNLNFPTTKLDSMPMGDLVTAIASVIDEIKPEIVYLPNRSDVHSDHRVVFDAAYSCTKNFRHPHIEKILMYETLSETEFAPALFDKAFVPNVFNDISSVFEKKIEILKIYSSELMEDNFPRSIEAVNHLAGLRGSRIGKKYAEAFMLLFEQL